jgi:cation diffusion facilitator family transporter
LGVLIEAFERILHPHQIQTDQLLLVSVLGLFVNLIGLYFFHDAHMHVHTSHGSGHSNCSHGHSHGSHDDDHHSTRDHNIRGIFLHVLADTLGSVGVIISSLLIYFFDLPIFDAICSLFIAILIFVAVYPLITSTTKILLLQTPLKCSNALRMQFETLNFSDIPGIIGYRLPHFFECEPERIIGTLHIQVMDELTETEMQAILMQVSNKLRRRFNISEKDVCIQIEQKQYLDSVDPIHHSVYNEISPIVVRHGHGRGRVQNRVISHHKSSSNHEKHVHVQHDHHGHGHGHGNHNHNKHTNKHEHHDTHSHECNHHGHGNHSSRGHTTTISEDTNDDSNSVSNISGSSFVLMPDT